MDITEHRKAQAALHNSGSNFLSFGESSPKDIHLRQLDPDDSLVFKAAYPAIKVRLASGFSIDA